MIGTNEMDIDTAHSYVQQGETDSDCLKKYILLYEAWIMTDRIATVQITSARMQRFEVIWKLAIIWN
jgi:hypothetical protein